VKGVKNVSNINTNKWLKFKCLQQDAYLVNHHPETAILSEQTLYSFLNRYHKVVIKPIYGAGGAGIQIIQSLSPGRYLLQYHSRKKTFSTIGKLFLHLRHTIRLDRYIIQQCITLARVDDRLFDLRIMVQRGQNGSWEVTGGLAKVAYRGYSVTNPEEYVCPIKSVLMNSSLPVHSVSTLQEEVNHVCLRAAEQLSLTYPDLTIIGFDIGIDVNGHIWIIEPNFQPAIYWFKQLPERQTYRNIVAYKRIPKRKAYRTGAPEDWIDEYYYYS
jgi:glutathione synthase/RimK-type ligase-like ATP-grasp enzyme